MNRLALGQQCPLPSRVSVSLRVFILSTRSDAFQLVDLNALLSLPTTPASLIPSIRSKLVTLEQLSKKLGEREKDEMVNKLKGIGDSVLGHFGLSTKNFQFTQQPSGGYSMNFVR